jgi:hypothetical protein
VHCGPTGGEINCFSHLGLLVAGVHMFTKQFDFFMVNVWPVLSIIRSLVIAVGLATTLSLKVCPLTRKRGVTENLPA